MFQAPLPLLPDSEGSSEHRAGCSQQSDYQIDFYGVSLFVNKICQVLLTGV